MNIIVMKPALCHNTCKEGGVMCIPHVPNKTFKADRHERKRSTKASVPFNKKLLEPDPDFTDDRKEKTYSQDKPKSLLDELLSIFK